MGYNLLSCSLNSAKPNKDWDGYPWTIGSPGAEWYLASLPEQRRLPYAPLLTTVFAPFCFQQLEKELEDRQPQVSSLQEISSSLLVKGHGEDYIEAAEKVHVIEKKLKQLREQVAQDLMSLQERLVSPSCCFSVSRWRRKTGRSLAVVEGAGSPCSFSPFGPRSFIK